MFNLVSNAPRPNGATVLYLVPFVAIGLLLLIGSSNIPVSAGMISLLLLAATPLVVLHIAGRRPNKRGRLVWLLTGLSVTAWLWTLAAGWLLPGSRDLMMAVLLMVLLGTPGLPEAIRLRALGFAAVSYILALTFGFLFNHSAFEPRAELGRAVVVGLALIAAAVLARAYNRLEGRVASRETALRRITMHLTRFGQRDPVTQTYNRRFLFEVLDREKARADRLKTSFSVALVDIDHFKRVNETYGHVSADRLLGAFARRLKEQLRGSDWFASGRVLGRFGAEEFLLLLPETRLNAAQSAVDRLRAQIALRPFAAGVKLTVSAGIAEYRLGEPMENTLKRAERALHLAQQWGRNRVEVDPEGGAELLMPGMVVSLAEHRARNA
jgi:diguanylate cyclase (GGDEF)-like protein